MQGAWFPELVFYPGTMIECQNEKSALIGQNLKVHPFQPVQDSCGRVHNVISQGEIIQKGFSCLWFSVPGRSFQASLIKGNV